MPEFRFLTSGLIGCLALSALVGCGPTKPKDYSAYNNYRANLPASILVLPPTNQSVEVNAPYSYLSTITAPVAEAG
ncbi:MAG: GNA1162 family protein, partial [Geminicoccaceae bacterium]